jgi:uncharacterized protein
MTERLGPLDLLVIQPTPFCNLDCRYCYLPDRGSTRRMAEATLVRIFERVAESGLATRPYTVVWHAGEPLVLPPAFYHDAFATAARFAPPRHPGHALAPDQRHPDRRPLVRALPAPRRAGRRERRRARVPERRPAHHPPRHGHPGAGPARDRSAPPPQRPLPRHHRADPRGARLPDELYAFYVEQGIGQVGFNVEEIEGPHTASSLQAGDTGPRYREFMARFFDLATSTDPPLRVREFDHVLAILHGGDGPLPASHETAPFAIVSVDCAGNYSTFSPELLGLPSADYQGFAVGNVNADSFAAAAAGARFRAMAGDVAAGVARCRTGCAWFRFCGGGAPANKYFENGSFDSTETLFCRLHRQALADVVLTKTRPPAAGPAHAGA